MVPLFCIKCLRLHTLILFLVISKSPRVELIVVSRKIIHPKQSLPRLFLNRRLRNYSLSHRPLIFLNSPGNFMQNLPLSRHWGVMDLSRGLSRLPRKSRVICSLSGALRKHRCMPGNLGRIYCLKEEHRMSLPDAANFERARFYIFLDLLRILYY